MIFEDEKTYIEPVELDYAPRQSTQPWIARNKSRILRILAIGFVILGLFFVARNIKFVTINTGGVECSIKYHDTVYHVDDEWNAFLPFGTQVQTIGAFARVGPPLPIDLDEPVTGLRYRSEQIILVEVNDTRVGCSGTSLRHHWWGVSLDIDWEKCDEADAESFPN